MLYDRPYMNAGRPAAPGRKSLRDLTAVQLLLLANAAVYLLGLVFTSFFGSDWLESTFSLSLANVRDGYVWTLFTYAFLHGSLLHLGINMLVLYFVGPHLERRVGYWRTLAIFSAAAVAGGVFWLAVDLFSRSPAHLVGASGGVIGIFTAFCMLEADRKMTFLLFFIFPVSLRPRVLLAFLAGFEFFNFLFNEIAPYSNSSGVGYSAHLGGIAAGLVAALAIDGKMRVFNRILPKKKYSGSAGDYSYRVNIMTDSELREETNRILDKINAKGFSSLSDREKEILSIAKDRLK